MQWPPPAHDHHLVITALTMKNTASIKRMCDIKFFCCLHDPLIIILLFVVPEQK